MFGPRFNEQKLKVNLGLCVTRLKLMEKKKTDQALRARPEIAEYVRNAKVDRARVRVEHIIREDYLVEAMELVEMYADLLSTRIGLLKQSKVIEENLKVPISTLIWAMPRLQQYCQELKVVHDILGAYYGKKYLEACKSNSIGTVCERVIAKLDPSPPKKVLVERYLIEICHASDVPFTPDTRVMEEDMAEKAQAVDTDFMSFNQDPPGPPGGGNFSGGHGGFGGGGSNFGGGGGGGGQMSQFSYAASASAPNSVYSTADDNAGPGYPVNNKGNNHPQNTLPPYSTQDVNFPPQSSYDAGEKQAPQLPTKAPAGSLGDMGVPPNMGPGPSGNLPSYNESVGNQPQPSIPTPAPRSMDIELPSVPTGLPGGTPSFPGNDKKDDEVDFDDLTRRFENLKKKK